MKGLPHPNNLSILIDPIQSSSSRDVRLSDILLSATGSKQDLSALFTISKSSHLKGEEQLKVKEETNLVNARILMT